MDVETFKTTLDPESLKIILALQEEKTLLERGIGDIIIMLKKKKGHPVISYDNHLLHILFKEIYDLYPIKEKKQDAFDKSDNPSDGSE